MTRSKWTVDLAHSEIGFTVKHMMISKAKGTFDKFDMNVEADVEDISDSTVEVTIDAASVNTRNEDRDNHLRSADFFDVENHPNITFVKTDVKSKGGNQYDLIGDLTINGHTNQVTLDTTFEGVSKDPMGGGTVAGFSGNTTISRKEFGLTWNAAVETGGVLVSDDVNIHFELELHKAE